jgi:Predicted nucleotide-binding protein containing TIR-like domain
MLLYPNRDDSNLAKDLIASIVSAKRRLLYAGNIMTSVRLLSDDALRQCLDAGSTIKIVLMYPYSLFARDRMVAERQRATRNENGGLACGGTFDTQQAHWIASDLVRNLQKLLADHSVPPEAIRLTTLNTLCSVLVCDDVAFLTPYHYGRTGRDAECTAQVMPVIRFDNSDKVLAVLADHVEYLWNQPTSLALQQSIDGLDQPEDIFVLPPDRLMLPRGDVELSRQAWIDKDLMMEQILRMYSPSEIIKRRRATFLSHPSENLPEARSIKGLIQGEFYADVHLLLGEDLLGASLFSELKKRIGLCSHAIVLAARDCGRDHPKANVIHELGYCQALMGSENVLVLKYPDVGLPSNLGGIIYENYSGSVEDLDYIRRWLENRGFKKRVG